MKLKLIICLLTMIVFTGCNQIKMQESPTQKDDEDVRNTPKPTSSKERSSSEDSGNTSTKDDSTPEAPSSEPDSDSPYPKPW
ncbi:hypothetical protein [Bacillus sp. 3255]|uniref:hypothetical protein n=1 Tax=Bacillus sp. 3255 TaxID=2817904 RepID=UPI002855D227|nr:hypothetical protein [Bacillus sp. 3255]MDR6880377.1 cytoskeletal protein RodZ [Bacillus sp. 3255]